MKSPPKNRVTLVVVVTIILAISIGVFVIDFESSRKAANTAIQSKIPDGTVLITPTEHKEEIYTPYDEYCENDDDCQTSSIIRNGEKVVKERDQYFTSLTVKYSDKKAFVVDLPKKPKMTTAEMIGDTIILSYQYRNRHGIKFQFLTENLAAPYEVIPPEKAEAYQYPYGIKNFNPSKTKYTAEVPTYEGVDKTVVKEMDGTTIATLEDNWAFGSNSYWANNDLLYYFVEGDNRGIAALNTATLEEQFVSLKDLDATAIHKLIDSAKPADDPVNNPFINDFTSLDAVDSLVADGKLYVLLEGSEVNVNGEKHIWLALENITDKKEMWRTVMPFKGEALLQPLIANDLKTVIGNYFTRARNSIFTQQTAFAFDTSAKKTTVYKNSYLFPVRAPIK